MKSTRTTSNFTPSTEGNKYTRRTVTVSFNEICEPGAYYFHQTGWLYRVPAEGISQNQSPMMNICSSEDCFVTKICDDPYVPVNKAREICANCDFTVNF